MPSETEIQQQIECIFWDADLDRSGTISMQELHKMLVQNGYKMTWDQFKKNFASFDEDGNNEISYDEYLKAMGRPESEWKRFAIYRKMFEHYDKSRDGYITKNELASVFIDIRKEITKRQLDILFKVVDLDRSGRIEYDEFLLFFFKVKVPSRR